MPSPTMQTRWPLCWLRSIQVSLSSGRHSAWKVPMPSSPAICRAALSWSPVSSTGVTPGGPDIPDGPGGVWPQGVCQGQKAPPGRPSTAT